MAFLARAVIRVAYCGLSLPASVKGDDAPRYARRRYHGEALMGGVPTARLCSLKATPRLRAQSLRKDATLVTLKRI
ncbi:hypothetical protein ATOBIA_N01210 [Atopobiaceae bacterium P1]|nr:hypothetical protein ATOBIA_N01210 [Atopobiaceae bacterium P1]